MEDGYDVALCNAGEQHDFNTISLAGIDIVVPVERDVDGDPFQDDEIRIRSEDGAYDEIVTVSDPGVEETPGGLLLYRFEHVPPGFYRIWARIGGAWSELLRGLIVSKRGAYYMGEQLSAQRPAVKIAAALHDARPVDGDADDEARYLENVDGLDAV